MKRNLYALLEKQNRSAVFELKDASRVSRDVGDQGSSRGLTTPNDSVTINPIRGDEEFEVKIQPHLNSGLWSVYIEGYDYYARVSRSSF